MLTVSAMSAGVGSPGPLVVAMYRDLLEDAAFRKPLAWGANALAAACSQLPRRSRRAAAASASKPSSTSSMSRGAGGGGGGGGGGAGGGADVVYYGLPTSNSGMASASAAAAGLHSLPPALADAMGDYVEYLLVPETVDGAIFVGAHPVTVAGATWDDSDLQGVMRSLWGAGRLLALFANAPQLLLRTRDAKTAAPLAASVMLTATPWWMEVATALLLAFKNCRWDALRRLCCSRQRAVRPPHTRSAPFVATEVSEALRHASNYLPGPSPLRPSSVATALVHNDVAMVRRPDAYSDAHAVVVESGHLLTAQCGGDAFTLARRFAAKLELVQRTY